MRESIGRLKEASELWKSTTLEQRAAWEDYAETLRRVQHVSLREYSPAARNVFIGLTSKLLQANPDAEVPLWPPASDFIGDSVVVETTVEFAGGDGETPEIVFTASGPNAEGVATELMVQKLVNEYRKPGPRYKSVAFKVFAPGDLEFRFLVEPGAYACAYRFVRLATGQSDLVQTLKSLIVGVSLRDERSTRNS